VSLERQHYRVPKGSRIRPSQLGYYNFWYPDDAQEYVSEESLICEHMLWRGSETWEAVMVTTEQAKAYGSPIRVVWIEKSLFKDMARAPIRRETLKKRVDNNE